jgi:uncharacterized membrane protein YdjX (TVP38/TMEM64 family)
LNIIKSASRWITLVFIVSGLISFYYFHGYEYLNFETLKKYHTTLHLWSDQHYLLSVILYILIYNVAVAFSIPGAVFITLAGGFLFGPVATIYVLIGATLGATLLFLAVRAALGKWLTRGAAAWVKKMERGFQENAFNYLLVLRLIPLFPFWAINIAAALLAVQPKVFVTATFLGIIPGAFVYVMVGSSLNELFKTNQPPNLSIIFSPLVLLPLIGLAILALLPVFYKRWKGKKPW